MSGGSFGYVYSRVEEFADSLERKLNRDPDFKPETIKALRATMGESCVLAKKMKEVEWLFSGDNGEEYFMRNIERIGKEALQ